MSVPKKHKAAVQTLISTQNGSRQIGGKQASKKDPLHLFRRGSHPKRLVRRHLVYLFPYILSTGFK